MIIARALEIEGCCSSSSSSSSLSLDRVIGSDSVPYPTIKKGDIKKKDIISRGYLKKGTIHLPAPNMSNGYKQG